MRRVIVFPPTVSGLRSVHVTILGNMGNLARSETYNDYVGTQLGFSVYATLTPPVNPHDPARGKHCDGPGMCVGDSVTVPTASQSATLMQSRDCPYLIIEAQSGACVAGHCGRDLLLPSQQFVERMVRRVAPSNSDRGGVRAFITCGISAEHFAHELRPDLVAPFVEAYGYRVLAVPEQLGLCLRTILRLQLQALGVENISHDGLDTFSHADLGSKRAQDAGQFHKAKSNWIIVERR